MGRGAVTATAILQAAPHTARRWPRWRNDNSCAHDPHRCRRWGRGSPRSVTIAPSPFLPNQDGVSDRPRVPALGRSRHFVALS